MSLITKSIKPNKLLLVFIHGFKGDDTTFQKFPERIHNTLTSFYSDMETETIIYPRYETRGDLKKAVEIFCNWLEERVEHEEKMLTEKGSADAIIRFSNQLKQPKIIGLLTFDSPFYGVNSDVFSRAALERVSGVTTKLKETYSIFTATKEFVSTVSASKATAAAAIAASTTSTASKSGGFGGWGMALVGAAAIGAGATAYLHKEKVSSGIGWLGSHLEFVGVLININELRERVETLIKVPRIGFHCYYTQIEPKAFGDLPRTFIVKPPEGKKKYFSPASCTSADEIDAHITMFDPVQNQYFYDLAHNLLAQSLMNAPNSSCVLIISCKTICPVEFKLSHSVILVNGSRSDKLMDMAKNK
ncbi:8576_t:CDS:2 [Entrophospora sp. SA101]|nr:8576_t:CDS:2 [Entrophospora sp. SA101]